MKKLFTWQRLLLLITSVAIISCSDSNDEPEVLLPKLDGFYVYGTNTVAESAVEPNARMAVAALDKTQGAGVESMDGIYGKWLYIGANSTITFAEVVNEVGTTFGAPNGGTVGNGKDLGFSVNDNIVYGTLASDAPPIKVTDEGLYYAFVNSTTDEFVLMRAKANMIGPATPEGWDEGTFLPQKSTSKDSTVFENTNLYLLGGDTGYKYRFNDGWAAFTANNIVTLTSLGVEDYGKAWDTGINDVGFYNSNIPQKETGDFTVRLKYTASTNEWKETKIRSYTKTKVGLFGNAYYLPSGEEGSWGDPYQVIEPTQSGSTYTWTWNDVQLIEGRDFVVLENGTWGGMAVLYNSATVREGDAFTNNKITNGGTNENFTVSVGGVYDITLKINAVSGARTITIKAN
ncbi:MAG TPA: hypothetical protein VIN08_01215 [Ohtaekwangia sp.]|uniref:hypothetical protein n=1 Tax=Ohtaekwangia sp. TaxID=2066019 RepID=UPI002F940C60